MLYLQANLRKQQENNPPQMVCTGAYAQASGVSGVLLHSTTHFYMHCRSAGPAGHRQRMLQDDSLSHTLLTTSPARLPCDALRAS